MNIMKKTTLGFFVFIFSFNFVSAQNTESGVAQIQNRERAEIRTTEMPSRNESLDESRKDSEIRGAVQSRTTEQNLTREGHEVSRTGISGEGMTLELREAARNAANEGAGEVINRAQMLKEGFSQKFGSGSENIRLMFEERSRLLPEIVAERQAELLEKRFEMLQNLEARKARLSEDRQARVNLLVENILERLMSATERLNESAARIEERIVAKQNSGVEVGRSLILLEESIILIGKVSTEIEVVRAELSATIQDEVSADYVRDLVAGIRNLIQEAQKSLSIVTTEIVD